MDRKTGSHENGESSCGKKRDSRQGQPALCFFSNQISSRQKQSSGRLVFFICHWFRKTAGRTRPGRNQRRRTKLFDRSDKTVAAPWQCLNETRIVRGIT